MFYQRYFKSVFDFCIGIILLLCLWWLMVFIAVAILFKDGRPILFKQQRIGQYGMPFMILKFRTMVNNAESAGKSTSINDARITAFGHLLRKTSLDELPQIFNVLRGDMSFVGYRPGVREDYDESDFTSGLFNVKPGITGYAQVNGRSNLTINEKRCWELKYVKDISFFADIKILIKTLIVVLRRSNSN